MRSGRRRMRCACLRRPYRGRSCDAGNADQQVRKNREDALTARAGNLMPDARDASAVNLVGGTSFDDLAAMRRGIAFANDGACCQVALSQVFFCMNLPCATARIAANPCRRFDGRASCAA